MLFSHPIPVPVQHYRVLLLFSHFEIASTGGCFPGTDCPENGHAVQESRLRNHATSDLLEQDREAERLEGKWIQRVVLDERCAVDV